MADSYGQLDHGSGITTRLDQQQIMNTHLTHADRAYEVPGELRDGRAMLGAWRAHVDEHAVDELDASSQDASVHHRPPEASGPDIACHESGPTTSELPGDRLAQTIHVLRVPPRAGPPAAQLPLDSEAQTPGGRCGRRVPARRLAEPRSGRGSGA